MEKTRLILKNRENNTKWLWINTTGFAREESTMEHIVSSHRLAFENLAAAVKEHCKKRPVFYLANPGNWGDGLIRSGTLMFFKDLGLNFKELKTKNDRWPLLACYGFSRSIFGGGGAWCQLWDNSFQVRKLVHKFGSKAMVLPSTYETTFTIPKTTYFCRDTMQSQTNMPQAQFCHDMAFYIGNTFYTGNRGNGIGNFFRYDSESAKKFAIPKDNYDLSTKSDHWSDVRPFFERLDKYEVINTDRLHVAIGSCLLGKEVNLYANSYFKNKSVYLASIKDHFENIHFHESL